LNKVLFNKLELALEEVQERKKAIAIKKGELSQLESECYAAKERARDIVFELAEEELDMDLKEY